MRSKLRLTGIGLDHLAGGRISTHQFSLLLRRGYFFRLLLSGRCVIFLLDYSIACHDHNSRNERNSNEGEEYVRHPAVGPFRGHCRVNQLQSVPHLRQKTQNKNEKRCGRKREGGR